MRLQRRLRTTGDRRPQIVEAVRLGCTISECKSLPRLVRRAIPARARTETYCLNDLWTAIAGRSKTALQTHPAAVAQAWGRALVTTANLRFHAHSPDRTSRHRAPRDARRNGRRVVSRTGRRRLGRRRVRLPRHVRDGRRDGRGDPQEKRSPTGPSASTCSPRRGISLGVPSSRCTPRHRWIMGRRRSIHGGSDGSGVPRIAAGLAPPRALREAKLDALRKGGTFAKPYYWAPFEVFTVVVERVGPWHSRKSLVESRKSQVSQRRHAPCLAPQA